MSDYWKPHYLNMIVENTNTRRKHYDELERRLPGAGELYLQQVSRMPSAIEYARRHPDSDTAFPAYYLGKLLYAKAKIERGIRDGK